MNFPTITRYNWMCCSIILVFLALSSPKPLQAQENQKERITIQVKNQPIQKVFDDLSKQTGLNPNRSLGFLCVVRQREIL